MDDLKNKIIDLIKNVDDKKKLTLIFSLILGVTKKD